LRKGSEAGFTRLGVASDFNQLAIQKVYDVAGERDCEEIKIRRNL
jgi:hypothetical protein